LLYGDWGEGEDTGELGSALDVTTSESFANVIQFPRVVDGQIWSPATLIIDELNVDLSRVLSLMNQLLAVLGSHGRLLRNPDLLAFFGPLGT
jgi:hypothetical protein